MLLDQLELLDAVFFIKFLVKCLVFLIEIIFRCFSSIHG